MQLDLSQEERELLSRLVEREVGEMRAEIRRTANRDYHDKLQREEELLKGFLERLQALA